MPVAEHPTRRFSRHVSAAFVAFSLAALFWMTVQSLEWMSERTFLTLASCLLFVALVAAGGLSLHLVHWLVLSPRRRREAR